MQTIFFEYNDELQNPIYTIDNAIVLEKGTYVSIRQEDFIVESVNVMLGLGDDHIEVLLVDA